MKTIGIIGGLSWESSVLYYQLINEAVRDSLGGLHSAQLALYSFDFAAIEELQHQGQWQEAAQRMNDAAVALARAGADFVIIASNTMHLVAGDIPAVSGLPLLHIADPTAEAIRNSGLHTIALLGTRFTMEQDFYKQRLQQNFGLQVLIPEEDERRVIHDVIYDELCQGVINPDSRQKYRGIIANLIKRGAQGVILGCTEITLLVGQEDSAVPLFDTTAIHARTAAKYALE